MLKMAYMANPKVSHKTQYIVDPDGKKTGVVLDLAIYRQLLEDLQDLKTIAERRKNRKLSAGEFISRLKKNGRI